MAVIATFIFKFLPILGLLIIIKKLIGIFLRRRWLKKAFKDFPGPEPHFLWGNMKEVSENFTYILLGQT